jgi:ABC-type amino acid transport substrate-binding protein
LERDGLATPAVTTIYQDESGSIWYGSDDADKGGLSRYDGQKWDRFSKEDGLAHNSINTIYQDARGDIWFATGFGHEGGATRLYDNQMTSWTEDDGLAGGKVRSIYEDEVATEVVVEFGDNTSSEGATATSGERSVLAQVILDSGLVYIGVQSFDVWPMNVETDDERIGFEIWLAEEIVWRMFGDQVAIEWVPVSAIERFEMVESGAIDMLIRTTTHTTSREEFGLWSENYFLSGLRIAANADRGVSSFDDLALKDVAVLGGTGAELVLLEEAVEAGVGLYPVEYDTYQEACGSFLNGDVDAMIGDWIDLLNCTEGDPGFVMITDILASDRDGDGVLEAEPFGLLVPPGETAYLSEVNAALLEIIEDGTWQLFYDIWFEEALPWNLEQMLSAPPVDR